MEEGPVAELFPAPVVCAVADEGAAREPLAPEEEGCVAGAGAKRARQFRGGRACAREALRRLGLPAGALPSGSDGAPVWPTGIVGSITHCPGLCAAAVAPATELAGLGLDAERAGRAGERVLERIASPAERRELARLPALAAGDWPTLLFAAKEALYKCVAARAAGPLRFRDVRVSFEPCAGLFRAERRSGDASLPELLHGRFRATRTHVAAGVLQWRAASGF